MFVKLMPFLVAISAAASAAETPHAAIVSLQEPGATGLAISPRVIALRDDRIVASPALGEAQIDQLTVRISSPTGVLWQGDLRVAQNQGANYSQNFSQASPTLCSANSPYDRSERSSVSLSVYRQNNGYGTTYRFEASWQRPSEDAGCGERGTRTVQVSKTLTLNPGESGVVEGDAGLRVEVTRRR